MVGSRYGGDQLSRLSRNVGSGGGGGGGGGRGGGGSGEGTINMVGCSCCCCCKFVRNQTDLRRKRAAPIIAVASSAAMAIKAASLERPHPKQPIELAASEPSRLRHRRFLVECLVDVRAKPSLSLLSSSLSLAWLSNVCPLRRKRRPFEPWPARRSANLAALGQCVASGSSVSSLLEDASPPPSSPGALCDGVGGGWAASGEVRRAGLPSTGTEGAWYALSHPSGGGQGVSLSSRRLARSSLVLRACGISTPLDCKMRSSSAVVNVRSFSACIALAFALACPASTGKGWLMGGAGCTIARVAA